MIVTRDLQIGYDARAPLLKRAGYAGALRGETVAIIGANGVGKSTCSRRSVAICRRFGGRGAAGRQSGNPVIFAQATRDAERGERDDRRDPRGESRCRFRKRAIGSAASSSAAMMSFARSSSLSGGERGRLSAGEARLQGAKLLLLDEPTNHLDIDSQEVLQAVLADFSGTILLVSHDRYLIDALATQIWELTRRAS